MRKILALTSIFTEIMPTCRYCGSTDVRLSKSVYFSTRHVLYRCNTCKEHFKVARISFRHLLPIISYALVVLLFVTLAASIYVGTTQVDELTQHNTRDAP